MVMSARQSVSVASGVRGNNGPRVVRTTYGNLVPRHSQPQAEPHSGKRRTSVAAKAGKVILALIAIGAAVYLVPRPVARTATTIQTQDVKPPAPVVASPAIAPTVPTQQQKSRRFSGRDAARRCERVRCAARCNGIGQHRGDR